MIVETDQLINPFPGLRSFEPEEVDLFFGREEQVDELLIRLQNTHFLAVLGPSGSGKSSLVRAGLLPSLYGGIMIDAGSIWRIAYFRPGVDPIGELARALSAPGVLDANVDPDFAEVLDVIIETTLRSSDLDGLTEAVEQARLPNDENLIIVVDQFEELFTRNAEVHGAQQDAYLFSQLLINAARQETAYIIITMRSDFLGDCTKLPELAETINEGMYLIPRMSRKQRRLAITGPVAVGGAEITTELVNRLLNDVGDNPDQLPILQHALMRTWDYWREHHQGDETLDLPHYVGIGKMAGALDQHAEEAYRDLPDDRHRFIAEKLFKRLTHKASDGRGVRSPTEIQEICKIIPASVKEVVTVADCFRTRGRTFLMPSAKETPTLKETTVLDISHESLMRVWVRLKGSQTEHGWLEEEAESAERYRELADTAALFHEGEKGLLKDPELQLFLNWRKQAFGLGEETGEARTAQEESNEAWAARYDKAELPDTRNYHQAMLYLDYSEDQRDFKLAEGEKKRKGELKSANLRVKIAIIIMIVIVLLGLWAGIQQGTIETLSQDADTLIEQAADAKRAVVAAQDSANVVRDRADAALAKAAVALGRAAAADLRVLAARESSSVALGRAAAADLRVFAALDSVTAAEGRAATAMTAADIAQRQSAGLDTVIVNLTKQSERLSRSSAARKLAILSSNRQRDTLTNLLALQAYRFQKEYDGSTQKPYLYDALRHAIGPRLDDVLPVKHNDPVRAVAYNSDGSKLASASDDGAITLSDSSDGTSVAFARPRNPARIRALAFSPKDDLLAAGTIDGRVLIWSVAQPGQRPRESCVVVDPQNESGETCDEDGIVRSVAFDESGHLYTADLNGVVKAWTVDGTGDEALGGPADKPDRCSMAAGVGNELHFWNLCANSLEPDSSMSLGSEILSIAYGPDPSNAGTPMLAVGTRDKIIYLFTGPGWAQKDSLRGHGAGVTAVAFHKDGAILASGSLDNTVGLWNINQPQEEPILLTDHLAWVWSVAFIPDGATLVSADANGEIRQWTVLAASLADKIEKEVGGKQMTRDEWCEFVGPEVPYKNDQGEEVGCPVANNNDAND